MPRHFAFRGDRLAFTLGIAILLGAWPCVLLRLRRRHARPHPALLGGRLRELHHQPGRHGPALATGTRRPAGGGGWRINAFGCVLTGVVSVVVLVAKAPESLLVAVIIPILVGMMLFINRQYRQRRRRSWRSGPTCHRPAAPPGARDRARARPDAGRGAGRQLRAGHLRRRPDGPRHRRRRGGRAAPGADGAAAAGRARW